MVNPKEIASTKTGIMYLGLLIQGVQIEELLKLYDRVGQTAWFEDPTWYRDNADHADQFKEILGFLLAFQKASQEWLDKFGEKSGIQMTVNKIDEFKTWLVMEFMLNTSPEMKDFLGLDKEDGDE